MGLAGTPRGNQRVATFTVKARTPLDFAKLQEKETARLEAAAALRFWRKLREKREITASGEKEDSAEEGAEELAEEDHEGEADEPPPTKVQRVGNQGTPWGNLGWSIAKIYRNKTWTGMGAICGGHRNPCQERRCQKTCGFGPGLDEAPVVLR